MKSTRVFLGNAPWYKPGYYGVRAGSRWPHFEKETVDYYPFPFFLAYAAAVLEKEDFPVLLVDAVPQKLSERTFLDRISNFQPEVIVLETSTASLKNDLSIARLIRDNMSSALIIFCGPHAPMYEKSFLKETPVVDMVMSGEYEFTLLDVVKAYENNHSFNEIPGLLFRQKNSGTIIKTPERALIKNLERFPWPSRKYLPMEKYQDYLCGIPQPGLQMWSSRGCPYKCSFCFWPHVMYLSSSYRLRDPEDVLDEIEYCLKTYSLQSVYFDDDTFNINKQHVMAIAQGFIDRRFNIPWGIMARADHMDEEMLEKLVESGLWGVKYGIESGSQDIVNKCGKNLNLQKVQHICALTRKSGLKMHLTFTFGLPGETRQTARQTLDFALAMNPDSVQFSIATPFPGSRFYEEMEQNGKLTSDDWEQYDGYNRAVIATPHLTSRELEEIRNNADKMFALRQKIRQYYPEVYTLQQIEQIQPVLNDIKESEKKVKRFQKNKIKYFFKAIFNPCWLLRKVEEWRKYRNDKKTVQHALKEHKK